MQCYSKVLRQVVGSKGTARRNSLVNSPKTPYPGRLGHFMPCVTGSSSDEELLLKMPKEDAAWKEQCPFSKPWKEYDRRTGHQRTPCQSPPELQARITQETHPFHNNCVAFSERFDHKSVAWGHPARHLETAKLLYSLVPAFRPSVVASFLDDIIE